jgi:nucleoside-diphosphate-sugar epimerase
MLTIGQSGGVPAREPGREAMLVGVTGASAFIGSALVQRHVSAGDEVRCLTRKPESIGYSQVQCIEGDLMRPDERLTRFADDLDVLYHCAGEVIDERRMQALNVQGTRSLIHAAAGRIGKWVHLSSAGVYGRHRSGVVSEETPLNPAGIYEQTKAEADALVLDAGRRGLFPAVAVLRPSIVFGRGMRNQSIVQMIRMIERGLFFFIGSSGASANYVHVSNVVDALVLCGRSAEADGRVYNLSDWCTVEEFAGAIADALGRPRPRLRLPERPVRRAVRVVGRIAPLPLTESRIDALVSRGRYSIERIQRELKYTLNVPTPAGLAHMVAVRSMA